MKKIFGICMGVGALLLGSCSSEEPVVSNDGGNVVFTATLPSEMVMSRSAYDDGLTATNLDYAVYDADGNNITALNGTGTFTDRQTTVSLSLVTGKTYTVVFWASADGAPYAFDSATGKVTVTTNGEANDKKRDAFFAHETFTVTGAISKTIELKRPFAQINIGTNDLTAFTAAGGSITKSGVTVTAPNVLNLLDGSVEGDEEYVFTPAAFLDESEAFPVEGTPAYRWLTTAFVLTGDAKTTVDVKWTSDNTTAGRDAVDFTFVPVQRNYRTNIYGALLTNPAEYNVIIDQTFETPDYNQEILNVPAEKVSMNNVFYNSIADAVNAAKATNLTDVTIVAGDGEYDAAGFGGAQGSSIKNITFIGAGNRENVIVKVNGSVYVDNVNISFENITDKRAVGTAYQEPHFPSYIRINNESYKNCIIDGCPRIIAKGEVTFTDCVFNNNVKSGFDGYSIHYYGQSGSNLTLNNCEFNCVSKAVVLYSETNAEYNFTANNCTFKASEKADKCAIQMHAEYGIYGTVNINNCTATGFADDNGGLWNELNNNTKVKTTNFNIFVDGTQVQTSTKK